MAFLCEGILNLFSKMVLRVIKIAFEQKGLFLASCQEEQSVRVKLGHSLFLSVLQNALF